MAHNLEINMTGNLETRLASAASGMGMLEKTSFALGAALGGMSSAMGLVGKSAAEGAREGQAGLEAISNRLGALRDSAVNFIGEIKDFAQRHGGQIIADAATFQDSQADLRFAFGASWKSVYDQVLQDSAALSFTFQDVTQLAAGLGRLKINPFGGTTEASQKFVSKTGEAVRALQIVQDAASASGRGASAFMFSLREAISGDMKSIRDALDLPKTATDKWKKSLDALHDPQSKYNYMIKELGALYGGAGMLKALNYNTVLAQIPDLIQQIRASVGTEGLKIITASLNELVGALGDLAKDKDAMASLARGFSLLASAASKGIDATVWLVEWVHHIIDAAPWLPVVAAGLTVVSVAIAVAGAAFLAASISVTGFMIALTALEGTALLPVMGVLLLLSPLLIGLGVTGAAVANELTSPWNDTLSVFEKVKIVYTSLSELLSSYDGTTATMGLETADKLRASGLEGLVYGIMDAVQEMDDAWEEFTFQMDEMYDRLAPTLIPLWEECLDLFNSVADALGINTTQLDLTTNGAADFSKIAATTVDVLGTLAEITIGVARGVVGVGRAIMWMGGLIKSILEVALWPFIKAFEKVDAVSTALTGKGIWRNLAGETPTQEQADDKASMFGFHRRASAPDAGRRDADRFGAAYKGQDGSFSLGNVYDEKMMGGTKEEFLADPGKFLDDGDLARIKSGRKIRGRMRMYGTDRETAEGIGGGSLAGLEQVGSDQDFEKTLQKKETSLNDSNLAFNDKRDAATKQEETNRLLRAIHDRLGETGNMSVNLDSEKIATVSREQNMSVAGE